MARTSRGQELESAAHIVSPVRKQRAMTAPFDLVQDLSYWNDVIHI